MNANKPANDNEYLDTPDRWVTLGEVLAKVLGEPTAETKDGITIYDLSGDKK